MTLVQLFIAVACSVFCSAEQVHPRQLSANALFHQKLNGVLKERESLRSRLAAEKRKENQQVHELAKKDQIIATLTKRLRGEEQLVKGMESRVAALEKGRDEDREASTPPEDPVPPAIGENADNDDVEELGVKLSADDDDGYNADVAAVDPEENWDQVINSAEPPAKPPQHLNGAVQATTSAAVAAVRARGAMQHATDAAAHAILRHGREKLHRQKLEAATDDAVHAVTQHSHQRAIAEATDVAADIIQQHMEAVSQQQQQHSEQQDGMDNKMIDLPPNADKMIDIPPNEDDDDDNDDMAFEPLEDDEPMKTIPQLPLQKKAAKSASKPQYPVLKAGPYVVKLDHADIGQRAAASMEAKHRPAQQTEAKSEGAAKVVFKLRAPHQPAMSKTESVEYAPEAGSAEESEDKNDEAEVEALEKDDADEDAEERKLAESASETDDEDEAEPTSDMQSEPVAQEEIKSPKPVEEVKKVMKVKKSVSAKPATKPSSKKDVRAAARAARAKVVESAQALRAAAQQVVSDSHVSQWESDAHVSQWAETEAAKAKTKQAKKEEMPEDMKDEMPEAMKEEMPEADSVSNELRDVTTGQEALRNEMNEEEETAKAKADAATAKAQPSNFEAEALTAETIEDKEAAEDEQMLNKLAADDNANV